MILLTTLDNKEMESKNLKHLSSTTSSLRNQPIKTTPLTTEVKQLTQFIESINIPSTHKPLEFTNIAAEFIGLHSTEWHKNRIFAIFEQFFQKIIEFFDFHQNNPIEHT
jgi:hypothetical protein